jgi:archaetidylinositol phosphate synthase
MLSVFKPVIEKPMQPVARALKNVNPNYVTMLGFVFPILFFICVVQEQYALALFVFIFNGVDMLDGMIARSNGKVTAFGGFLDSTIDRFADFIVIAAFGFAHIVAWEIVMPFILLTYAISYMRSRIELASDKKLVANVGIMERTERLVGLFIGLLLYALFPDVTVAGQNLIELTCIIMIILSAVTVLQRFEFAYKKLS